MSKRYQGSVMENMDKLVKFAKEFFNNDLLHEDIKNSPEPLFDEMEKIGKTFFEKATAFVEGDTSVKIDTNDFDVIISLSVDIIRNGTQLDYRLREFVAGVLEGKIKRPKPRGPDKNKHFERDYKLMRTVFEVNKKSSLPFYYKNEMYENKITAAQIVSTATGIKIDTVIRAYNNYKNLYYANFDSGRVP
jgi:hypothetical protein